MTSPSGCQTSNAEPRIVYIVGIASADTYVIRFVCLKEETAKEKFELVKQELIKEAQEYLALDVEDGCEDSTFTNLIQSLIDCQYPGEPRKCWTSDHPVVDIYSTCDKE